MVLITFKITNQLLLTFTTHSTHSVTMGDTYQPPLNSPRATAGRLFANPANVQCTWHFGITISEPILSEHYKVTEWSERAVKWPISHFNHTFHDNPNKRGFTFTSLVESPVRQRAEFHHFWALICDIPWYRPRFGGEKVTFIRPLPVKHFFTKNRIESRFIANTVLYKVQKFSRISRWQFSKWMGSEHSSSHPGTA